MAIKVFCEGCNKTYNVRDNLAGKRARCPGGHLLAVELVADPVGQVPSHSTKLTMTATPPALASTASTIQPQTTVDEPEAAVSFTTSGSGSTSQLRWVVGGTIVVVLLLAWRGRQLHSAEEALSSLLVCALVLTTHEFIGKGWLIAFAALLTFNALGPLVFQDLQYDAIGVLILSKLFQTACLELFLLSLWSRGRMQCDMNKLLFSYSGRIPRSVYWISLWCILVPTAIMVWRVTFTAHAEGFHKFLIWVVSLTYWTFFAWSSVVVAVKRCHDLGISGWMTFGSPLLLKRVMFERGTSGPNLYGEDPLLIDG